VCFDKAFYRFCIKSIFFWFLIALPVQIVGLSIGKQSHDAIAASLGLLVVFAGSLALKLNVILTALSERSSRDTNLRSDLLAVLPIGDLSSEMQTMAEGSVNVIVANFRKFIEPSFYIYALNIYILLAIGLPIFLFVFFPWYIAVVGILWSIFVPALFAHFILPDYLEDIWFDTICEDMARPRERYFMPADETMSILMASLVEKVLLYKAGMQYSSIIRFK